MRKLHLLKHENFIYIFHKSEILIIIFNSSIFIEMWNVLQILKHQSEYPPAPSQIFNNIK